ncbi:MAG: Anaphase-promoting complex subunit 5 [Stictis urceolatum]|nr:Anaphase-promoting complex subunit 5 [Stictis urceolata]
MSRYLTPTKIGLLALVSLYAESVVSTSATVPLLSLIVRYIIRNRSPLDEHQKWDVSPGISIENLQATTSCHASAIPGRTLWDLLLKKFWSIDSFDALHVFFGNLCSLVATNKDDVRSGSQTEASQGPISIKLSGSSPIGMFVRRSQLEFIRLPLHDGISLWRAFQIYREPTLPMWKKRNPAAAGSNLISRRDESFNAGSINSLFEGSSAAHSGLPRSILSAEDAERILEFQIDQMQKFGQRVTGEIKQQLEEMFHAGSTTSSLSYYIMFLDAWKEGDHTSAFDNLHRYFDYTMHIQGRTFYQYALVNMAIMQADFECYSEAISAMQEAVTMARENRDMGCLNFCLSWLYHFSISHPGEMKESSRTGALGNDREALSFIKIKAKESGMWSLLSTTLLGEAGVTMAIGESISQAFESLARSSYLNIAKNIAIAHGNQMLVELSIYSRLGLQYMQWGRGEVFLECYARRSLSEDSMKFLCLRALALSRKGKFDQAIKSLESVDPATLRTLRYQQAWLMNIRLLKFEHALRADDLSGAQHYLWQLQAAPPKDRTMTLAVSLLHVKLLIRHRQLPAAMSAVDNLITDTISMQPDIHAKIKLMLMKARIFDESGIPQKGFSIAIRAANIAYKSGVLDMLWEAIIALCRILCSLSEFHGAAKLIRSVLPQVLEVENCELAGASFSCLGDAHMGMGRDAMPGGIKRKEHMTKALECLESAFYQFSKAQDKKKQCEVLAKRAAVLHVMGELVLANDSAAKYLAIDHTTCRGDSAY